MKLAVYCAGGFGREIYDIAYRINQAEKRWDEIVFIDNYKVESPYDDVAIFTMKELPYTPQEVEIVVANGEPFEREVIFNELSEKKYEITTLVDPLANVSTFATLGKGSIVIGYTMINAGVSIGNNVVIQSHCVIGHDIWIDDHTVLSSGFMPSGNIKIGKRVFVGLNTCTIDGVQIGDDSIVSLGSVIYKNVATGMIVMGNPARPIRRNDKHKVFK